MLLVLHIFYRQVLKLGANVKIIYNIFLFQSKLNFEYVTPQIGQYAVIDDIVPAVDEDLKVTKDLQKELAVISTCYGLQRVEPDEIGQLSFPHLEAANRLDKPSSEKIGPGIDPDRY